MITIAGDQLSTSLRFLSGPVGPGGLAGLTWVDGDLSGPRIISVILSLFVIGQKQRMAFESIKILDNKTIDQKNEDEIRS